MSFGLAGNCITTRGRASSMNPKARICCRRLAVSSACDCCGALGAEPGSQGEMCTGTAFGVTFLATPGRLPAPPPPNPAKAASPPAARGNAVPGQSERHAFIGHAGRWAGPSEPGARGRRVAGQGSHCHVCAPAVLAMADTRYVLPGVQRDPELESPGCR